MHSMRLTGDMTTDTAEAEKDLSRWVQAGLIDSGTADRIRAYEAERRVARQSAAQRPTVLELLIYLAGAIAAAGFVVLVGTNWEHLSTPARIAIPGGSAALMFAAGHLLRRTRTDAMVRGASVSWLVASALAVGAVAIAANEAGWSENNVAITAGLFAAVVSVVAWSIMRMHPQIVGIGAAAFLLSTAISVRASEHWTTPLLGASLALFGFAALMLVERGVLVPRSSARLLAGAGLVAGAFFSGLPPAPLIAGLIALAVVVLLLAAGFRFASLLYIGCGVLAAFVALIELILRHVHNPTLAGLTLIALSLLLLLTTAVLREARPWRGWRAWRGHIGSSASGHDVPHAQLKP